VSWKGTEKCTSIPRKGIRLHENNGTGQIMGQGWKGRKRQGAEAWQGRGRQARGAMQK